MKHRWLQLVFLGWLSALGVAVALGQGPGSNHPPGGPPGNHGPGGPPGPGGGPPPNGASANTPNSALRGSVTTRSGLKLGPPGRWWDDKTVSAMVNLRKDQQKSMDAIFNANKPAIIATYKTFEKEQANLNSVSGTAQVDKSQMFAAIDRVNQARAALEKANTEMLLQIRNQLDPAQIAKLESIP
jgi:Spy/CpxP family protein refolding chaperone